MSLATSLDEESPQGQALSRERNSTVFNGHTLANLNETPKKNHDWADVFGLVEITNPERRRALASACLIEFVGTLAFEMMHVMIVSIGINGGSDPPYGPIALAHGVLLTLLIYCFVNSSGAHFNPLITFATMTTGQTKPIRAFFYIAVQIAGAALGAKALSNEIGGEALRDFGGSALIFPACTKGMLSDSSAWIFEMLMDLTLLYSVYGLALDPVQGKLYGPVGPIGIGLMLALLIWTSFSLSSAVGFTWGGNPAFCVGSAVGDNTCQFSDDCDSTKPSSQLWYSFVGAFTASVVHWAIYILAPPSLPKGEKAT